MRWYSGLIGRVTTNVMNRPLRFLICWSVGAFLAAPGMVRAQGADVVTTLAPAPATALAGADIVYTVTVENISPKAVAQDVKPQLRLTAGLSATPIALPPGASYANGTGIVALPTTAQLAPGPANALVYVITLTAPNYSTVLTAVASSTASTIDPQPANNNGSQGVAQSVTVVALAANTCSGPTGSGFYGEYYADYFADDLGFFSAKTPGLQRQDGTLNFPYNDSWGNIVPPASDSVSNPAYFSARYRSTMTLAAGTYTFYLTSDDASFLWLDAPALAATPSLDSAAINNGGYHPSITQQVTLTLAAGPHPVLVFYGQSMGDCNLTFEYSGGPDNLPRQIVPNDHLCAYTPAPTKPLPVELTTFTAQAGADQSVLLRWTTASERNSAAFDVERSADGQHFGKIGQLAAQGTSVRPSHYSFADANRSPRTLDQLYYRLRAVDRDASASYSPVRVVRFGVAAGSPASWSPNPTRTITILDLSNLPVVESYLVILLDATGRPVLTTRLSGGGLTPLDVSRLPPGLYLGRVTGPLPDGTTLHQGLRLLKE